MPRVPDVLRHCAVYLYPDRVLADIGDTAGGTGFLLAVRSRIERLSHIYAVTNRHVIEDGACVVRANRRDGKTTILDLSPSGWRFHPDGDDLALHLISLHPGERHEILIVRRERILTPDKVVAEDIGIGDETLMVGRFIQHDGRELNKPAIRFGNIARVPDPDDKVTLEPYKSGGAGFDQEAYLVEGRTIPGYSGSPVFVSRNSLTPRPYVIEMDQFNLDLLGVECGHLSLKTAVDVPSGMAVVVPAWRLNALLDDPHVVEGREAEASEWEAQAARAVRFD